jgi:hypothetical protein
VKGEIGASGAELRGFLDKRAASVNARTRKINKQKQSLMNMV